jgi:tetratricopeptide (TPR) repeat protein
MPESKGFFRRTVEFALDRDVEREIEHQRAILARFPENARAAFDLGVLLNSQGQKTEAMEMYRRAIGLDPTMAQAHQNLGEIYVTLDRLPEAWEEARKAAGLGRRSLLDMLETYAGPAGPRKSPS